METSLSDPALWHRIHFGFTITYHYLFPQLTMGLAWFLVYWKWRALRTGDEKFNRAARFWARIFGLNFAVGVVTGIPLEFQFGPTGPVFPGTLARSFARHWQWKECSPSFSKARSSGTDLGREATRSAQPLPGSRGRCHRQLAFRFFYFGHKCFHATSDRLLGRIEWHARVV